MSTTAFNGAHKGRLETLYGEAVSECDKVGVPYGYVGAVTENTRATRRWGRCEEVLPKFNGTKGYYRIEIASRLLTEGSDKAVKETLIHELLHTVRMGDGHRGEWARWAGVMNRAYGYNIKRADSDADKGLTAVKVEVTYKYAVRCTKCGKVIGRQRMSDLVRFPSLYTHKMDNGTLERVR